MDIAKEVAELIGRPEGARLEYKAVLPPARTVAQLICSFANSQGGFIVLGVADVNGKLNINGLSEEFHATAITHKAIDSAVATTRSQLRLCFSRTEETLCN